MSENFLVIIVFLLAAAFIIRKILKAVSCKASLCGCGYEKDCAGCRDLKTPHTMLEKKHADTGGESG